MNDSPSTKERAQAAAGTAVDDGKQVAGTAAEEARAVASEAAGQARRVLDDAVSQASEQSKTQQARLAETLRGLADDLGKMADGGEPGLATSVAKEVADRARSAGSYLEDHEPSELLDEARRFARRRPGVFLLGSLAAGVVAGRLLRGAADGIAAAEGTGAPVPLEGGAAGEVGSAPTGRPYVAGDPMLDDVSATDDPLVPGGPAQSGAPRTTAMGSGPEMGYGERGPGEPSGERGVQ
ncbi:hypothetical protein [Nocardioides sp. zg-DK7169]|uniref:hypothetical protein n=1 Tax=Nocardioides sp. zg-DK7169 TaxID=2736600 RepID=UPI0015551696|nr:hypothetical protein [Nocardioides sp. zg-DK7169]NPC95774.1 hypothetical protein [Nocardioides sp. zg-DK7169]